MVGPLGLRIVDGEATYFLHYLSLKYLEHWFFSKVLHRILIDVSLSLLLVNLILSLTFIFSEFGIFLLVKIQERLTKEGHNFFFHFCASPFCYDFSVNFFLETNEA